MLAQYDSILCRFRPVCGLQCGLKHAVHYIVEARIAYVCCSYICIMTSVHHPHVTKMIALWQVPGCHQAQIQLEVAAQTIMHAWLGRQVLCG